ncbi:MAG: hypothetical protein ACLFVU_09380 [Phycisphaerae bacterium]
MRSLLVVLAASVLAWPGAGFVASQDTTTSSKPADSSLGGNVDYWLERAETVRSTTTTQAATQPSQGRNPFSQGNSFSRPDALPGGILLSDGTVKTGGLYTTRDKPWIVYQESTKRWRRIPFAAVLSIQARIVEEKMELEWRWKATGVPERVYTGRKYPTRRFLWVFTLADGSTIVGAIKGQPLWVDSADGKSKTRVILHERTKGTPDQTLEDMIYLKKLSIFYSEQHQKNQQ